MSSRIHPRARVFRLSWFAAAIIGCARFASAQDSFDYTTEEGGRVQNFEVLLNEVQIQRSGAQPTGLLKLKAEGVLPGAKVIEDGSSRVIVKLNKALDRSQASSQGDVVKGSFPEADVQPVMYVKGMPHTQDTRRIATKKAVVYLEGGKTLEEIRALGGADSAEATRVSNVGILTFKNAFQALNQVEVLRQAGVTAKPMLARYMAKHAALPKDKFFSNQWHLVNTGQNGGLVGVDVNVLPAWDVTLGNNTTIAIVDDCLETTHPDLKDNCPPLGSKLHHDFIDVDDDPRPVVANGDFHGTCVAGLAGAQQNNGVPDINDQSLLGVSGVAPNTRLLGLRLIAGPFTDEDEGNALYWHPLGANVAVCNNSWGPNDGLGIVGMDVLGKAALRDAAFFGRGGRGQVTVFSAGNGRGNTEDANNSTTSNSRFVTTVGAINSRGTFSSYSTYGASLLVCAPGGEFGSQGVQQRCTTTDVTGTGGFNPLTTPFDGPDIPNLDYTNQMNGTSSAAPITSGVAALMLSANPELGWRDVKEILASTARKIDPDAPGWLMRPTATGDDRFTNEAGFKFSHDYGAGLVDAGAAVTRALTWTNLVPEAMQSVKVTESGVTTIPDNGTAITRSFNFTGQNLRLEQIEVEVRIKHQFRSQLEIALISPSGVRSVLAQARPALPGFPPPVAPQFDHDYADIVLTDAGQLEARAGGWVFSTTHHWGENSQGTWKVEISDKVALAAGSLEFAEVRLYGTPSGPERVAFESQRYSIVEPAGPDSVEQKVTIRRLGPTTSTFTVGYATTLSSATPDVDFTPVSGTVTFNPGDASKDIFIPILPDASPENTETVNVILTNITGVTGPGVSLGGNTLASIDILDDEAQTVTVVAADNRAQEVESDLPQDSGTFIVSRSKVTNEPLPVFLNIGGTATGGVTDDYDALPSQVVIPAFERSVTLPVKVHDDLDMEGNETVTVTIFPDASYSIGNPGTDTVTIVDNDRPKVQIVSPDNRAAETELEVPPNTASLTLTRTGENGQPLITDEPLTVFLYFQGTQVLGQNYILRYTDGNGVVRELLDPSLTNSVQIPAGSASVNLLLIPKNDDIYNATKTAIIGLLPNDAYDFSFGFLTRTTVTIEEDDAPLDGRIPTVTITSPKNGSRFEASTTNVITITGKASDNETDGLKKVQYRLNGGDWTAIDNSAENFSPVLPTTSTIYTLKLDTATLPLGENIVEISSVDKASNESKTAAVKFTYVQNRTLTVNITGSGTVTKGFAPSSLREANSTVTLTASPQSGQVFDKWVLNPGANQQEFTDRTITFVMPNEDQTLNAIFVTSPFTPEITGSYNGLVEGAAFAFETSGFLKLNVSANGTFSSQLIYGGKTYSLKGEFNGSGIFNGQIKRKKNTPLKVSLNIDVNPTGTKRITGSVSPETIPSFVTADRAAYGKLAAAPAALVKNYTLFFPASETIGSPQGTGWATMSIDTKGIVKWSGRLPDGTNASQTIPLSKDGTWPLFVSLYSKRGVMLGSVTHADVAGSDLSALVDWQKLSRPKDKFYPAGFVVNDVAMVGSIYTPPAPGTRVIDGLTDASPNATVKLENGNLLASINETANVGTDNSVSITGTNANKVSLSINASKGTFSGSFVHPVSFKKVKLNGVVFQKTDLILGNFLGSSIKGAVLQTGRVTMAPAVPTP